MEWNKIVHDQEIIQGRKIEDSTWIFFSIQVFLYPVNLLQVTIPSLEFDNKKSDRICMGFDIDFDGIY